MNPSSEAFNAAAKYCACRYGGVSIRQIREKLKQKGFSSDEIQQAIDRCEELNLFNEEELAKSIARLCARKKKNIQYL